MICRWCGKDIARVRSRVDWMPRKRMHRRCYNESQRVDYFLRHYPDRDLTLAHVASILRVSRQRVSQIERAALVKLKSAVGE